MYDVLPSGKKEIDLKRYAKVEKIAGGELEVIMLISNNS